jgi:hypothetical protein
MHRGELEEGLRDSNSFQRDYYFEAIHRLENLNANPNCQKDGTSNEQGKDQVLFTELPPFAPPSLHNAFSSSERKGIPLKAPSARSSFLEPSLAIRYQLVRNDVHVESGVTGDLLSGREPPERRSA